MVSVGIIKLLLYIILNVFGIQCYFLNDIA